MKSFNIVLASLIGVSSAYATTAFKIPELSPYFEKETLRHSVVINGDLATAGSQTRRFTADLSFERTGGKIGHCSGSLIHPKVILTAAHCIVDEDATTESRRLVLSNSVEVRLGLSKNDPEFFAIESEDIEISPKYTHFIGEKKYIQTASSEYRSKANPDINWDWYDEDKENIAKLDRLQSYPYGKPGDEALDSFVDDVALIFLDREVPEFFKRVSLVPSNYPLNVRDVYYGAGFGGESFDPKKVNYRDRHLRFAKKLLEGHLYRNGEPAVMFGLPHENKWPCDGDSGGPALLMIDSKLHLLGLYSYYYNGCAGYQAEVLVAPHTEWIESEMNKRGLTGFGI